MVRHPAYRQRKYEAKIDADVVRSRFASLKDLMVEQTSVKFSDLADMEDGVKRNILEPAGVPTIQIPFYLNYARQLYRLTTKFSGQALINEAKLKIETWVARGLNRDLLVKIAEYFGIPIEAYY